MDLSQIISPDDIRNLSYEECEDLADDIRTKIIQTVSKNGGHLIEFGDRRDHIGTSPCVSYARGQDHF